jgi:hypothetical protein
LTEREMRLFYFVGGPTVGNEQSFLRRLVEVGGPPPGWQVFPFLHGSGQALHLVSADAEEAIEAHLANFAPGYERGPVVELVPHREHPGGARHEKGFRP